MIGEEILHLKERTHVTSLVVSHDRDLAFGRGRPYRRHQRSRIITIARHATR